MNTWLFLILAFLPTITFAAGGADTGGSDLADNSEDEIIKVIQQVKSHELPLAFQRLKVRFNEKGLDSSIKKVLSAILAGNRHNPQDIFQDIQNRRYILKRNTECYDKHENSHDASFESNGSICFSLKRLKKIPSQELLVQLTALAAHEHIHAYNFWDEASDIQDLFLSRNAYKNFPRFADLPLAIGAAYSQDSKKFTKAIKTFAIEFIKESSFEEYAKQGKPNLMTIRDKWGLRGFGQFNQIAYAGKIYNPLRKETVNIELPSRFDFSELFMATGIGYQTDGSPGYACTIRPEVANRKGFTITQLGELLSRDEGILFICDEDGRDFEIRSIVPEDFVKYSIFYHDFSNHAAKLGLPTESLKNTDDILPIKKESNKVCAILGIYTGLIQSSYKDALQTRYRFPQNFVSIYNKTMVRANSILQGYCEVDFDSDISSENSGKYPPISKDHLSLIEYWHELKTLATQLQTQFEKYYYLESGLAKPGVDNITVVD